MNKKGKTPLESFNDLVISKYYKDPLELLGERSFKEPQKIDESVIGSPVQEFFRDAVVLLTGGTGFMGKITLEKLLRTCPHIKHIYLLIRSKKGKEVEQRLEDIFEDRVSFIKSFTPKYFFIHNFNSVISILLLMLKKKKKSLVYLFILMELKWYKEGNIRNRKN